MSNRRRAGPYRPGGTHTVRFTTGVGGGPRGIRAPQDGMGHTAIDVYRRAAAGPYRATSQLPARSRKHRRR